MIIALLGCVCFLASLRLLQSKRQSLVAANRQGGAFHPGGASSALSTRVVPRSTAAAPRPDRPPPGADLAVPGSGAVARVFKSRIEARLAAPQPDGEALADLVAEWACLDTASCIAWIESLPQGEARPAALGTIVRAAALVLAEHSAREATALVSSQLDKSDPQRDPAIVGIVQRLAQRRPAEAAGWVGSFPPSRLQIEAAREVAAQWAETDAPSAARWINTLPPGPMRDEAASALCRHLVPLDPGAAELWMASIGDTARRAGIAEEMASAPQGQPSAGK